MPKYIVEKGEHGEIWKNEKGQIHREDGPAVINSDGTHEWWLNGKLHREDGPAIVRNDGLYQWWINGKNLTEQQFNDRKRSMDGKEITIDGITYTLKRK